MEEKRRNIIIMNWYKKATIKGVYDAKGWEEIASRLRKKLGREPGPGEIQDAYFEYLFRVPKRRTVKQEQPVLV